MNIKLFEKITDSLIENGTINTEDKEIYEYGLRHIANVSLNILSTLFIGFIFGMVWQSVIFMTAHIPLRSYAGGAHARTPLRCYIVSVIMTVCILLGIKYIPHDDFIIWILTLISGIVIFIFAPIGDENKPLDEIEIKVFRFRTRVILLAEIAAIGLFTVLGLAWVAFCIAVSVVVSGFMVLLAIFVKILDI